MGTELLDNLGTSAGFTYPGRKKYEVLEHAYMVAKCMEHRVKNGMTVYQIPSVLGFRGHLSSKDEPKTRPIWVFPIEMILMEKTFAEPLQDLCSKLPQFANGKGMM